MFTYGFYNSVNHDRVYDAKQMSSIFDGIIKDGIFASIGTAMQVEAGTGLTVNVGIGRAWFNHTWSLNDSIMPIEMPPADEVFNRIDAVILEIGAGDSVRENSIKIVQGEPATSPIRPTLIKQEPLWQYPLCYIYRPMGSTSIQASQITNMVGTDEVPFISGVLQTITLDQVLGQWRGELDEFVAIKQSQLQNFYNEMQTFYGQEQADFASWRTQQEKSFNTWFKHIQESLNDNVVTELSSNIEGEAVKRILVAGFDICDTIFEPDGNILYQNGDNTLHVVFNNDGSITKTLIYNGVTYVRTTVFNPDGNISEV